MESHRAFDVGSSITLPTHPGPWPLKFTPRTEATHVISTNGSLDRGVCRQVFERAIQRRPHVFGFSITMRHNLPPTFSFGSANRKRLLCRYIDSQRSLRRFQHPLLARQIAADRRQGLEIVTHGIRMGLPLPPFQCWQGTCIRKGQDGYWPGD